MRARRHVGEQHLPPLRQAGEQRHDECRQDGDAGWEGGNQISGLGCHEQPGWRESEGGGQTGVGLESSLHIIRGESVVFPHFQDVTTKISMVGSNSVMWAKRTVEGTHCKLISLVKTVSEHYYFVTLLFCTCANCEWNGMGTCQDQALCVGCVDLCQCLLSWNFDSRESSPRVKES